MGGWKFEVWLIPKELHYGHLDLDIGGVHVIWDVCMGFLTELDLFLNQG